MSGDDLDDDAPAEAPAPEDGPPDDGAPPPDAYGDDAGPDGSPDPYADAGPAGAAPGDPLARSGLPRNDVGNAERLRLLHGDEMIYVPNLGWGIWDGRRFNFQEGDLLAQRMAESLSPALIEEAAAKASGPVSEEEIAAVVSEKQITEAEAEKRIRASRRQGMMTFAISSGNLSKMDAALKALRNKVMAKVPELDAVAHKIAAQNGALDLRVLAEKPPEHEEPEETRAREKQQAARILLPHDKADKGTRLMGVAYDPDAVCPKFDAFMELIQPEEDIREYLLRGLSLTLYGRNDAQTALLLRGGGGNGKSTLLNVIAHLLGDYSVPCSIELFLVHKNQSAGQATPETAVLPGARAYRASETEDGDVLSSKQLKLLTGGELMPTRELNKGIFYFTPVGIPILSFNRAPQVKGDDDGIWDRLAFIPFNVNLRKLPHGKRRPQEEVERELIAEGPGILNRLLRAFADYRAMGLQPPPRAEAMKGELRAQSDPVGEFLADCTEPVKDGRIKAKTLYAVFEQWCGANSHKPMSSRRFAHQLTEKEIPIIKTNGGVNHRRDIDWIEEDQVMQWLRLALGEG